MRYLLDTNVLSELNKVRVGRADVHIAAWAQCVDAADLFVSVIGIVELELSVSSLERNDATSAACCASGWSSRCCLSSPSAPCPSIPPWRSDARLHVPDRRSEHDALIVAMALVHGMAVVTRNVADFEPTGVPLVNPWERQP